MWTVSQMIQYGYYTDPDPYVNNDVHHSWGMYDTVGYSVEMIGCMLARIRAGIADGDYVRTV